MIALADGVTSCAKGDAGAKITCDVLVELMLKQGERFMNLNSDQTSFFVVAEILRRLRQTASEKNENIEEYSSTAAFVLLDKEAKKLQEIYLKMAALPAGS